MAIRRSKEKSLQFDGSIEDAKEKSLQFDGSIEDAKEKCLNALKSGGFKKLKTTIR